MSNIICKCIVRINILFLHIPLETPCIIRVPTPRRLSLRPRPPPLLTPPETIDARKTLN